MTTATSTVTKLEQLHRDTLCTCIEGGSSYWLRGKAIRTPDSTDAVGYYYSGLTDCFDVDDRKEKFPDVTLRTIASGMRRIADGRVQAGKHVVAAVLVALRDPDEADIDADVADCILQAGLFNSIVYG